MNTAAGISIPYINKVRSNHMNKDVSDRCHSAPPRVLLTGPALRSKVLLLATVVGAAYVVASSDSSRWPRIYDRGKLKYFGEKSI